MHFDFDMTDKFMCRSSTWSKRKESRPRSYCMLCDDSNPPYIKTVTRLWDAAPWKLSPHQQKRLSTQ